MFPLFLCLKVQKSCVFGRSYTDYIPAKHCSPPSRKYYLYYLDKQITAKLFHVGSREYWSWTQSKFCEGGTEWAQMVVEPLILQSVLLPLWATVFPSCLVCLPPLLWPSGGAVIHKLKALDTVIGSGIGTSPTEGQ